MHPLLNVLATRPQLLAEHAQAYAELVAAELPQASSAWLRQAQLKGLAALGLLSTVLLAGVASLLWATVPLTSMPRPWLLLVVPLVPAIAGIVCLVAAKSGPDGRFLSDLRQQLSADLAMLQTASTGR